MDKIINIVLQLKTFQKLLILAVVVLVIAGGYGFFYKGKVDEKNSLKAKIAKLNEQLQEKKDIDKNLIQKQKEMNEIKEKLKNALKMLPTTEEMPSLLSAISADGNRVGLEFLLFKPQTEKKLEFYAEIPIEIKVLGTFHEVALFFDAVAELDRIVNIRKISMDKPKDEDGRTIVTTTCSAATFRYYTLEERKKLEEERKAKAARKRPRRKKR